MSTEDFVSVFPKFAKLVHESFNELARQNRELKELVQSIDQKSDVIKDKVSLIQDWLVPAADTDSNNPSEATFQAFEEFYQIPINQPQQTPARIKIEEISPEQEVLEFATSSDFSDRPSIMHQAEVRLVRLQPRSSEMLDAVGNCGFAPGYEVPQYTSSQLTGEDGLEIDTSVETTEAFTHSSHIALQLSDLHVINELESTVDDNDFLVQPEIRKKSKKKKCSHKHSKKHHKSRTHVRALGKRRAARSPIEIDWETTLEAQLEAQPTRKPPMVIGNSTAKDKVLYDRATARKRGGCVAVLTDLCPNIEGQVDVSQLLSLQPPQLIEEVRQLFAKFVPAPAFTCEQLQEIKPNFMSKRVKAPLAEKLNASSTVTRAYNSRETSPPPTTSGRPHRFKKRKLQWD